MEEKTWYLCNPTKNTDCRKRNCRRHGRGRCVLTSDPESALEYPDGDPVRVSIVRTAQGFKLELVKE